MDVLVEVTTGVAGVVIGIGAGRMLLGGLLAVVFGRRV